MPLAQSLLTSVDKKGWPGADSAHCCMARDMQVSMNLEARGGVSKRALLLTRGREMSLTT